MCTSCLCGNSILVHIKNDFSFQGAGTSLQNNTENTDRKSHSELRRLTNLRIFCTGNIKEKTNSFLSNLAFCWISPWPYFFFFSTENILSSAKTWREKMKCQHLVVYFSIVSLYFFLCFVWTILRSKLTLIRGYKKNWVREISWDSPLSTSPSIKMEIIVSKLIVFFFPLSFLFFSLRMCRKSRSVALSFQFPS